MPHDAETRPNSDFSALLAVFNDGGVDYLLIGGRAYSFHDEPRYTKDYDLWIRPTKDNADRAYAALIRFGAPLDGITRDDLIDPEAYYAMGVPPNRIDVLSAIEGITFDEAWPHRVEGRHGEERMWVIGIDDLITNKRAIGRPSDLIDVAGLERRQQRQR
ncbi:MAG: hypothetical protein QOF71_1980 [Candidatus Eremiobacteraeota bacterium]|jgi:hypothetical protein|nr:hypothetical protein [Candidatus Eremiobacteraeota bacterium]